jgi:MerR family transcriptional regulator, copper efflux regulator
MEIHELAQQTGLTAPTIRFYEKEGLLNARYVRRRENNYRDYCQEAVRLLLIIKKMQAAGFTLAEIKELFRAYEAHELPLQKLVDLFLQKMKEIDRKHAELEQIQMHLEQMLAHKIALMSAEGKGKA